jgi:hypothetical protein
VAGDQSCAYSLIHSLTLYTDLRGLEYCPRSRLLLLRLLRSLLQHAQLHARRQVSWAMYALMSV